MHVSTCALCETHPAKWNDPASAENPSYASAQADALEKRVEELERGAVTLDELHARMLEMCGMCREIVCDVPDGVSRDAVKDRIRYCIGRLRMAAAA